MRKSTDKEIRRLTGIALLLALAVALGFVANYVQIGSFSMNLSLIPVVMSAILYGPVAGLLVGLAVGGITIAAPATLSMITALETATGNSHDGLIVFETVLVCLVKMAMAGLIPGFIFKGLKKKHFNLAVILASVSAPIINTGIFSLFMLTLMYQDINLAFNTTGANMFYFVFVGLIGVNFFIEFGINAALSPMMVYLTRFAFRNVRTGSDVIGKQVDTQKENLSSSSNL